MINYKASIKKNLRLIPGFRSNFLWKKIIAIIGYLFMIIILSSPDGITNGDKLVTFIEDFLILVIPFILVTNVGNIRNKLPLYKTKRKGKIIIGTIVVVIFLAIIMTNMPKLYSTQYKQETLLANVKAQAESDAKDKADAKVKADEKAKIGAKAKIDAKAKVEADAKAKVKADAKVILDKKVADAKVKTDAKAKADAKKIADAKVILDKKVADAKVKTDAKVKADDKKIADAKVIQDKKVADAKVKTDAKAKADAKKIADAKVIANAKIAQKVKYKAWVDAQFSAWNGSNTYLVDLVKNNLNDDTSFKHVSTSYKDMGTYLIVKMTYRAKNGFGALILQNVTAKADYKTNTINIISQNN